MCDKKFYSNIFLEKIVERAVKKYNRYREPEAKAHVLEIRDDKIIVKFTGSFCNTCGIRDWVEDFKYILEEYGIKNQLIEYIEPEDNNDYRIGIFEIEEIRR